MIRSDAASLLPVDVIDDLFTRPVLTQAIPARACTVIRTTAKTVSIPITTATATATWVDELEEIPTSSPRFGDVTLTPTKVAGIVPASNELLDDASPEVQQIIGAQLVEATTNALNTAFLTDVPAPAPQGLAALKPTTRTGDITAFRTYADIAGEALDRNAPITTWIVSPKTRSALVSAMPLVSTGPYVDPSPTARAATVHTMEGAEIIASALVPDDTVWGIPASKMVMVVRKDVEVRTSEHALFGRDGTALRSIMRVAFGATDPTAVIKITAA